MTGSCPLCSGSEIEDFVTKSDRILYHRCLYCGYIVRDMEHRLTPEAEKYRYELHNNSVENQGYVSWINTFLDFAFDPVPLPGSRILDFGSGPEPVMAGMMRDRGYEVLEEDPYFAPGRRSGKFDLITSLEVFEHLEKPFEVLSDLGSRLADGGRICISTEFSPGDFDRFEYWRYRSDETHIGLFTWKGLSDAATRAGLEELRCDGVRYISFRLAHRGASC